MRPWDKAANGQPAWSSDDIEILHDMWLQGFSGTQIGAVVKRSRNAVIGKVYRLGLPRRKTQIRAHYPVKPKKALTRDQRAAFTPWYVKAKPKTAPKPPTPEAAPDMAPLDPRLTTLKLSTFTCRYPYGDPKEPGFTYCGRTCDLEQPYCVDHTRLCYVPGSSLEKRTRLERLAEVGRQSGVAA